MKRIIAALAILFAGAFFMAPAASASNVADCGKGTVNAYHKNLTTYVASTTGVNCTVYLATYKVPATWDGKGWNETASPQELFAVVPQVLTSEPVTIYAQVPECGAVQTDLVLSPPPEVITYPQGPGDTVNGTIGYLETKVCEVPPTPTQASADFNEPTCKYPNGSFLTEYNKQEVTAKVEGEVGPGQEVSIIFTAKEGYKLTTESVWTHTFDKAPTHCGQPNHPDHPNKPDHPGKPEKPNKPDHTVPVVDNPELPDTGFDSTPLLVAGIVLIAGGAGLLVWSLTGRKS